MVAGSLDNLPSIWQCRTAGHCGAGDVELLAAGDGSPGLGPTGWQCLCSVGRMIGVRRSWRRHMYEASFGIAAITAGDVELLTAGDGRPGLVPNPRV